MKNRTLLLHSFIRLQKDFPTVCNFVIATHVMVVIDKQKLCSKLHIIHNSSAIVSTGAEEERWTKAKWTLKEDDKSANK